MLWEERAPWNHEETTESESQTRCWILSHPAIQKPQQKLKGWSMLCPLHEAVICYRDWNSRLYSSANALNNTAQVDECMALTSEDIGSGLISRYSISTHRFVQKTKWAKQPLLISLVLQKQRILCPHPHPIPTSAQISEWELGGQRLGSWLLQRTKCIAWSLPNSLFLSPASCICGSQTHWATWSDPSHTL